MAQRAGVLMVGVSWGARTREELELICPDGVVDNWRQFMGLLDLQV
jgi:phosphoglycolate phosphatase-like HAD superfamily hydrolase